MTPSSAKVLDEVGSMSLVSEAGVEERDADGEKDLGDRTGEDGDASADIMGSSDHG